MDYARSPFTSISSNKVKSSTSFSSTSDYILKKRTDSCPFTQNKKNGPQALEGVKGKYPCL